MTSRKHLFLALGGFSWGETALGAAIARDLQQRGDSVAFVTHAACRRPLLGATFDVEFVGSDEELRQALRAGMVSLNISATTIGKAIASRLPAIVIQHTAVASARDVAVAGLPRFRVWPLGFVEVSGSEGRPAGGEGDRAVKVGVLGAWSIDNSGDALIGWATRLALRARLPGADVIAFAPRLPGRFWGHDFGASRGIDGDIVPVPADDLGWTRDLDALVVGGGGVIIQERGFDTFLLDEHWSGPPAAWNAVCSQSTPAAAIGEDRRCRVRRACEQLAYVSVRNSTTATFLRQCGFKGPVVVAPDPAFADVEGVPAGREPGFPVGLSLGPMRPEPGTAAFYSALFDVLDELTRGRRGATIHLIPFGTVYQGDTRAQRVARERFPGCRILGAGGPLEAWHAVGGMRLLIGARLHAIIGACTQGVPFLALDEHFTEAAGTSKVQDLLAEIDLESYGVRPAVDHDPRPALERALALADFESRPFAGIVARMRARLDAHWDAMVAALGLCASSRAPVEGRAACMAHDGRSPPPSE